MWEVLDKNQYEATLALWQKHGEGNPYRKADIDEQKRALDERFVANHELRMKLEKERLEALCSTPSARETIRKMALGIMAENQPAVREYETAVEKLNVLQDRLDITKERLTVTCERLIVTGDEPIYKTTVRRNRLSAKVNAHLDAQLISDALLGNETAIPKVMQSPTGDDDDWSMLTESAKQEKLADARFREDW